jgi:hypothetical protein
MVFYVMHVVRGKRKYAFAKCIVYFDDSYVLSFFFDFILAFIIVIDWYVFSIVLLYISFYPMVSLDRLCTASV